MLVSLLLLVSLFAFTTPVFAMGMLPRGNVKLDKVTKISKDTQSITTKQDISTLTDVEIDSKLKADAELKDAVDAEIKALDVNKVAK